MGWRFVVEDDVSTSLASCGIVSQLFLAANSISAEPKLASGFTFSSELPGFEVGDFRSASVRTVAVETRKVVIALLPPMKSGWLLLMNAVSILMRSVHAFIVWFVCVMMTLLAISLILLAKIGNRLNSLICVKGISAMDSISLTALVSPELIIFE